MKPWIALLAAALLVGPAIIAQDKPAEPRVEEPKENPKADAPKAADGTVSVDFEYDGLVFVQTKINGKGPYKFLFDSGATQSVLNQRLADDLGLKQHDMPGGVQGVGTAEAKLVVLDSVEIGGFRKGKSIAATLNLDHISGTLGYHMMGIIGQNVIRTMQKIEIDFSTSRLGMTPYPAGETPSDWQEQLMVGMLEGLGGGGFPGLPGIPGLPGGPQPEPPEDKDPGQPREEEFSWTPGAWWLLQDEGADETQPPRRSPTEDMSLTYTSGDFEVPFVGSIELIPYWYLEVEINDQKRKFMFDTGASMLLVIGDKAAQSLSVTTSFGYPVKGIGTGQAHSGLVESFSVGAVVESDCPCTVMELPSITGQLGQVARMVPGLDKLDFDGIIGLPLATRFKRMIVDTREKKIDFVAYGKDEVNDVEPFSSEEFVKEGVIRTWQGKAAEFGLSGDSVQLEDWKELGLENGGLRVESVVENGPAAKAGLKKGDIITHLVGVAEEMPDDLEDADLDGADARVRDLPALIMWACTQDPGSEVTVRVRRGEEAVELKVVLGKYEFTGTVPERFAK